MVKDVSKTYNKLCQQKEKLIEEERRIKNTMGLSKSSKEYHALDAKLRKLQVDIRVYTAKIRRLRTKYDIPKEEFIDSASSNI